MQKLKLPLSIDAIRTTQKCLDYAEVYAPEQVTDVAEYMASVESYVEAALSFAINNQRLAVISGHANVEVTLRYQRFNQPLRIRFTRHSVSVRSSAASRLRRYQKTMRWLTSMNLVR